MLWAVMAAHAVCSYHKLTTLSSCWELGLRAWFKMPNWRRTGWNGPLCSGQTSVVAGCHSDRAKSHTNNLSPFTRQTGNARRATWWTSHKFTYDTMWPGQPWETWKAWKYGKLNLLNTFQLWYSYSNLSQKSVVAGSNSNKAKAYLSPLDWLVMHSGILLATNDCGWRFAKISMVSYFLEWSTCDSLVLSCYQVPLVGDQVLFHLAAVLARHWTMHFWNYYNMRNTIPRKKMKCYLMCFGHCFSSSLCKPEAKSLQSSHK